MSVARRVRACGVRVEAADLGAWGGVLAEYDARARTIRVSAGHLRSLAPRARRRWLMHAVAHELYHHLERIGEAPQRESYARRERAAERFARALVP